MLFTDFKKTNYTIRRDKLYLAVKQIGILLKLVYLVKMILKSTEFKAQYKIKQ